MALAEPSGSRLVAFRAVFGGRDRRRPQEGRTTMMGRITDLFGAKRHKTPPEAPMAIPIVLDIVVSRPDPASHNSLTDLELPGTPKGSGSGSVRSSAWQRIRHNNALGGLVRPLKRSKSQEKLRAALTNAAAKSEESAAAAAAAAALAASPPA